MKTTMPIATGMVALVVTMILVDGTLTVTHVNALIPMVVVAQPQDPLQLLKLLFQPPMYQLKDVEPLAGPLINGVMMKTTMLIVTGMVALVVIMVLVVGTLTAPTANASILHFQQPLPRQQPPLLHHQKGVGSLIGPMIIGVMMRTTMQNAIGMVELVASMIIVGGTCFAKIANVKSAHQLVGMEITIVMMISIPKVVNGMEEIAVGTP